MPEEPNPDSTETTQAHQEAPPSSTGSSEPTFITLAKLIEERPWSKAMVGEFLGEPDRTAPNPNYRSGPPMRLYDLKRIEQAEATPEFALRKTKYEARKEGSARKIQRQTRETHRRCPSDRNSVLLWHDRRGSPRKWAECLGGLGRRKKQSARKFRRARFPDPRVSCPRGH